jgi:activator of 2-hydroxyglutaryl-CoA dehydratase
MGGCSSHELTHGSSKLLQIEGLEIPQEVKATPETQTGDSSDRHFMIGLDVGSTTVKAVVVDVETDQIVWSD